jgi:hypothetical protein
MVYTLPQDFNKLPHFPSPDQLKRYILLKGKGSMERVVGLMKGSKENKTVSR